MAGLSLDDVLSAPQDPELLNRHLQNLGLIPAPAARPAESLVPMTPPKVLSGPPATVPLKPFTAPRPEHLPAMHSQEMPETPSMMTPPIVPSPDGASSPLVKPMTAPTLSDEQQKRLPETSPGMEGGSIPFYQQRLDEAIARNKRDSMSDHPSFLGKVGHVLGRVGNIALDTLAPGIGMNIPGTDMYKRAEESEAEKNLAGAKKEKSEEELRGAETEEARARARKLGEEGKENLILDPAGNIRGWHDEKGGLHSLEDPNTPQAIKEMAKDWEGKASGKPESIDQAAVNAKMQETNPATGKPYTAYEARVELANDIAKQSAEKTPPHVTVMKGGKPHIMERDPSTGEYTVDRGEAPPNYAMVAPVLQQRTFNQQEKMFDLRQQALTSATKSMIEAAPTVTHLADRIDPLIDKLHNELGPGAGRWTEFWAGKVGTKDPEYTKLRSDLGLLQTALMRMHVGARGGSEMMAHFKDIIDQGKQDPENLKAALSEIRQYAYELQQKGVAGGMNPDIIGSPKKEGGPPEGKTTVYDPQGAPHYVNSDKVEKFLNDSKYKGWSRNAPSK